MAWNRGGFEAAEQQLIKRAALRTAYAGGMRFSGVLVGHNLVARSIAPVMLRPTQAASVSLYVSRRSYLPAHHMLSGTCTLACSGPHFPCLQHPCMATLVLDSAAHLHSHSRTCTATAAHAQPQPHLRRSGSSSGPRSSSLISFSASIPIMPPDGTNSAASCLQVRTHPWQGEGDNLLQTEAGLAIIGNHTSNGCRRLRPERAPHTPLVLSCQAHGAAR